MKTLKFENAGFVLIGGTKLTMMSLGTFETYEVALHVMVDRQTSLVNNEWLMIVPFNRFCTCKGE